MTRDAERVQRDIRSRVRHPGRIEVRTVATPRTRLWATYESLHERRGALRDEGIAVEGFAIDNANNRLEIGVSSDREAAQRRLREDYPETPMVVVKQGPHRADGVRDVQPPFRGGAGNTDENDGKICTNGFTAYRQTVPTSYYMLTAGHCGAVSHSFKQYTTRIGQLDVRAFYEGSPADAARITILDATKKSNGVVIAPNVTREITSSAPVGTGQDGDYVCISTTVHVDTDGDRFNCDYVIYGSYDYSLTDRFNVTFSTLYGRLNSLEADPGDSGAPVLYGDVAHGVHSSTRDDGKRTYAHIYDVLRATGTAGVWPG